MQCNTAWDHELLEPQSVFQKLETGVLHHSFDDSVLRVQALLCGMVGFRRFHTKEVVLDRDEPRAESPQSLLSVSSM